MVIDRCDLRLHLQMNDPDGNELRHQSTLRKHGQFIIKKLNRVWSIDGHDNLSRFGFEIYGCIDAYSQYIIWCYMGHSNRSQISVSKQYLETVCTMGKFPKRIRSDMGRELALLFASHLSLRRTDKSDLPFHKAYSFGTSIKNQRIEAWWNLLANGQTDNWRTLFGGLEDRGLFDGGNIDTLCLQHIYMTMLRTHIHTFVQTHNTHRIRRQKQHEHYLPTSIPVNMYQYPKPRARDYGSPPNPETIAALEHSQHLDKYDLDEYIPSTTRKILNDLLSAKGLPIMYSWQDDHVYAYGELRVAVWNSINAGGKIDILLPPRKPEEWIAQHEANIEAAQGENLGVMDLSLTDDEELEEFNKSVVHDDDEYEDHELYNSENEDDGIVLDIMG
jgi:hypothetical protein